MTRRRKSTRPDFAPLIIDKGKRSAARPDLHGVSGHETDEDELGRVLSDCLIYNPTLFKEQAVKFAESVSMQLHEAACKIMLANGDHDAACSVLGDMLELATAKELKKVSTVSLVSQLLEEESDASSKKPSGASSITCNSGQFAKAPLSGLIRDDHCIFCGQQQFRCLGYHTE